MYTSLELSKRIEEFAKTIYPKLKNFPKSEKFSMCSEIKENIYNLYSYTARANYVKSKRLAYLQESEGYLTTLRFILKLARENNYLSFRGYQEYDLKLTEISKMLSGYIKSTLTNKE